MSDLRDQICQLVEKSIKDKQFNDEVIFCLDEKAIKRIKKVLHFNLADYICVISSHSIRHIYRGHKDDLLYVCEIPNIVHKFDRIEKSITKDNKTGSTIISLEFYKNYKDGIVKLVKLKVHISKKLELKTLFIQE